MASIYVFPAGSPNDGRLLRPQGVPDDLWAAVESVNAMPYLPGVRYREIPVPSTLADYGIGVELEAGHARFGGAGAAADVAAHAAADMSGFPPDVGTGWVMVLYCHVPRAEWGSRWRCVAFARLPLAPAENDSLAPEMYWDGMCDHLVNMDPDSLSGTVTVSQNTSFGSLAARASAGCEIRVSWTPLDVVGADGTMDAGAQVNAWAAFMASVVRSEEDDDR
ncbi:DUF3000 family protein [Bifidobacterium reuteri]|uniref:DUF3000 family protein n=1 Tax=Bifidobacterium reuteri TaxID=983706 RepID=A0A5J5E856_9BIFI|nr:DUF3000 family protein [Bifidobacterium reuteri]KAA8825586.1 DUF3000 family protein [Bifidobacterium reuteri]